MEEEANSKNQELGEITRALEVARRQSIDNEKRLFEDNRSLVEMAKEWKGRSREAEDFVKGVVRENKEKEERMREEMRELTRKSTLSED